nr:cytochrome P450 [Tanacetum cinerariifolium]
MGLKLPPLVHRGNGNGGEEHQKTATQNGQGKDEEWVKTRGIQELYGKCLADMARWLMYMWHSREPKKAKSNMKVDGKGVPSSIPQTFLRSFQDRDQSQNLHQWPTQLRYVKFPTDLNGNLFSVWISEERFQASSLVSPPSCNCNRGGFNVYHDQNDDYDSEVGSAFEEEFIGPTPVTEIPSNEEQPLNAKDGKSTPLHFLSTSLRVSHSVNIGTINSFNEETENVSLSLGQGCADDSIGPSTEINSNLAHVVDEGENDIQDDPELDDILSSFQRLSERANDNHSKCEKTRKSKPRKKNLFVGGASCPLPLVSHSDDAGFVGFANEKCAMKIIGEQIGIFVNCNGLDADNKRSWIRNMIENAEQKVADRNFMCVLSSWVGVSVKVVYGDFNAVRNNDERLGSLFDEGEANAFNDFISRAGLFDFPLRGGRFTRFSKDVDLIPSRRPRMTIRNPPWQSPALLLVDGTCNAINGQDQEIRGQSRIEGQD